MGFLTFKEFMAQRESSAYTRSRDAMARKTGVAIYPGSRSTPKQSEIDAWEDEEEKGKDKDKDKDEDKEDKDKKDKKGKKPQKKK